MIRRPTFILQLIEYFMLTKVLLIVKIKLNIVLLPGVDKECKNLQGVSP